MARNSRLNVKKSAPPAKRPESSVQTQNQSPGLGATLLGNVITGATFGVGSSLGHRAVDAVMSSDQPQNTRPIESQSLPCDKLFEMYNNCLKNEKNDCSFLADMMKTKCNFN